MTEVDKLKSTTAIVNLDGFDGYTDEAEGDVQDQEQQVSGRLIQGDRIAFNGKTGIWINASKSKQPLPADLQLVVADVVRVVQKWTKDNLPAEPPIILGPNEKWPNVEAMNEKCPKTEWRTFFEKMVGPYQKQKIVYLWDPIHMDKYTWPASSDSAMNSVSELVEKIAMMRDYKKVKAVPAIKLSSRLWSKKYGTLAPDFIVLFWVAKSADGTLLPPSEPTAISGPRPSTQEALRAFGVSTVTKPTGKEATGDEIPF
jgi:hypothetical protein